ncbi:hypothetical protein STCU_00898 [Strigomonas culicis]|uniref:Uncharacterized protein n=1 Tax=Strigomonas culicis TaxID=28005 RepID=S9V426_9TRYP|nr:hypothetical protein STCU_00898 [Strigomonas culicis]|eukprot:EPY35814.1 hypothetical protein STCU_00898 [Strigomonas culicis]
MLRNFTGQKVLSRQQKRIAVVAQQTSRNRGHKATHRYAVTQLKRSGSRHNDKDGQYELSYNHESQWRHSIGPSVQNYASASAAASTPFRSAPKHYEHQNARTGNSVLQERFDALVKEALLQYGPPLPAELVTDNHITTNAAPLSVASADLGADGRSFEMHDEIALKMTELFAILKKLKPSFTIHDDCDGVPLSLMVKNCSYFRAFGGKVRYMRFFKRERDQKGTPTISVSIGKYKMREFPSQDGVRQGPQPWLYSYAIK